MSLIQTPSQTVGPFFHDGLISSSDNVLCIAGVAGQRIIFTGRVLDGDGAPLPDALIELWQADSRGIYRHPADPRQAGADPCFSNIGRSDTARGLHFRFETVKPGLVPGPGGQPQAPHLCLHIFGRGLLVHLSTRVYFADEPEANAQDPVLTGVPAGRRDTLLAGREPKKSALPVYRLDLVLQGAGETVFFDP